MRMAYCVRAIFPQHGFGGLERSASALMDHLLMRGVDIALFTRPLPVGRPLSPAGSLPGKLTVHTVRYERLRLPPNGIPARLTNYRAFVDEMGARVERMAYKGYVDAIYAHGLCAWGVRRAAEWGVPLIANPHGMEEFKVGDPLKRLAYAPFRSWVRQGCRTADRVIATDHSMRGEVSRLLGVDPCKVAVVPNGVDIALLDSLVRADVQEALKVRWTCLAAGKGALKGISVGRLEANKGFEYLLRALAAIKEELGAAWTWMLVGEGSLKASLQEFSARLGLDGHVCFTGSLSDTELHSLYAMCDLFVHPTLYEGSSLVTLEAMAHALPVVASAVGGIPDKVIEGGTGFLVPPGDVLGLASKIKWMSLHPQERERMGAAGRERAALFSWNRIAGQTEDLLVQLIDDKAACRPVEAAARS